MKNFLYTFLFFINISFLSSQDVIEIKNPSFEERNEGKENNWPIEDWKNCIFKDHSYSIIFPTIEASDFNEISNSPFDGKSFIQLVTRADNSCERISQHLSTKLLATKSYLIQMSLAKAYNKNESISDVDTDIILPYQDSPVIVRIWGGNDYCNQKEFLAESTPIDHIDWKTYEFKLYPQFNNSHIEIEVYYVTPIDKSYNGNVLIDNLSDIYRIDE